MTTPGIQPGPTSPETPATLLEAAGTRDLAKQRHFLPKHVLSQEQNSPSIEKTPGHEKGWRPGNFLSLVYTGSWHGNNQGAEHGVSWGGFFF